MKKGEELTVITKTYDLILWLCNHTSKFPRNHRFVLGERVERNLYDLLETLIQAKFTRNRQALLEAANLKLEVLRFQMRLAKDLQCLKAKSYGSMPGFWPLLLSTKTRFVVNGFSPVRKRQGSRGRRGVAARRAGVGK